MGPDSAFISALQAEASADHDHDVPDEFIISVTDCEQKLSNLCVHKAMGPDNIPNWILRLLLHSRFSNRSHLQQLGETKLCAAIVDAG